MNDGRHCPTVAPLGCTQRPGFSLRRVTMPVDYCLLRRQRGSAATWLLVIVVVVGVLWWLKPWKSSPPPTPTVNAEPRAVAARGSLAEDEQNNIAVFKAAS